ncbi:hypothetical protein KYJ26_07980 [Bacillus sp. MCCB 382]|nr:hypothetical protein [Bacillus sp. MCCB 382]
MREFLFRGAGFVEDVMEKVSFPSGAWGDAVVGIITEASGGSLVWIVADSSLK